jgi:hypothetical protein
MDHFFLAPKVSFYKKKSTLKDMKNLLWFYQGKRTLMQFVGLIYPQKSGKV